MKFFDRPEVRGTRYSLFSVVFVQKKNKILEFRHNLKTTLPLTTTTPTRTRTTILQNHWFFTRGHQLVLLVFVHKNETEILSETVRKTKQNPPSITVKNDYFYKLEHILFLPLMIGWYNIHLFYGLVFV